MSIVWIFFAGICAFVGLVLICALAFVKTSKETDTVLWWALCLVIGIFCFSLFSVFSIEAAVDSVQKKAIEGRKSTLKTPSEHKTTLTKPSFIDSQESESTDK